MNTLYFYTIVIGRSDSNEGTTPTLSPKKTGIPYPFVKTKLLKKNQKICNTNTQTPLRQPKIADLGIFRCFLAFVAPKVVNIDLFTLFFSKNKLSRF
jgi:hypothetical protein